MSPKVREIRSIAFRYGLALGSFVLVIGYEMHVKKPVEPHTLAEAVARLGKRRS